MTNEETVRDFFAAFARRDYAGMTQHYHADAVFEDPVFGKLLSKQIEVMWKMLCLRGHDLQIELKSCDIQADSITAQWEARYTFSKTGRFVINRVRSVFTFRDGKIATQSDSFDFWKWSRQALGFSGQALGWTPLVRNAVRGEAKRSLLSYEKQADETSAGA